jgi:ribosomal protein S18 acetylase RimI-like enzyme
MKMNTPDYVEQPSESQVQELISLIHLCFKIDYFTPQLIGYRWLLVIEEGKIIACTQIVPLSPSITGIINLCVHPDHRRKGLAREMLWNIFRRSREQVKEFQLQVKNGNDAAIQLYLKEGFEIVPDSLLECEDCINMRKLRR